MLFNRRVCFAVAMAACVGLSAAAQAETQWNRDHLRREQVNERLARQDARIDHERREREISGARARSLHRHDEAIRHEERRMAAHDNSHITPAERARLNHQENGVSHEIGR